MATDGSPSIPIAGTLGIRGCGYDEYWLQDQIYENPACLGFGDLEPVSKERIQSSGGRLDILLKNPEDDTMYEVEVMLGETDESHIIRTIEYWDNEKRRWPQRQHYAVLVAESVTRRFFNVIQLLSHSIPIIAIQGNIVETNGVRALHFIKVLDTYEEVDDGATDGPGVYDEEYWRKRAPWTLEHAQLLKSVVSPELPDSSLGYVKSYIAIMALNNTYFRLHRRSAKKTLLSFRISDSLREEATALLDEQGISFVHKGPHLRITVGTETIENNREMFLQIVELVEKNVAGHTVVRHEARILGKIELVQVFPIQFGNQILLISIDSA